LQGKDTTDVWPNSDSTRVSVTSYGFAGTNLEADTFTGFFQAPGGYRPFKGFDARDETLWNSSGDTIWLRSTGKLIGTATNSDSLQHCSITMLKDTFAAGGGGYADSSKKYVPVAPDSTVALRADGVAARPVGLHEEEHFLYANNTARLYKSWLATSIGNGTLSGSVNGTATHPGYMRLSSGAAANTGASVLSSPYGLLLAGSERTNCVFVPAVTESVVTRIGFLDQTTGTAATDGVSIRILGATARGFTADNSTRDSTASTFDITAGRPYWSTVDVVSGSKAIFTLKDSTGALLWKDSLTTNIPTGAGRVTGNGITTIRTGEAATTLVEVDYIDIDIYRRICAGSPN